MANVVKNPPKLYGEYDYSLMVANYTTGEVLSIEEVNSHTMRAITKNVGYMLKRDKTEDIRVIYANNVNTILYIENYINRVKLH